MRNLFRPPSGPLSNDLVAAERAVLAATPLSVAHAKELPFAVRDLSRLLTQDRSQLSSSYWVNKRLLTAYCRYFLPWNLLRLAWLLPGLDLPLPEDGILLDLGSGPLTMPLALWLAKPEWRSRPLTVVCGDVAPAPMNLGRDIFRHLAPDSPWKIEITRGPVEKILREFSRSASLVTAANVLNELKPSRETPLHQRLEDFVRRVAARLSPGGRFLAVEPGTRLGGKLMALIRRAGFASGLVPETPCPHWGPCPMLAERATGWCHFTHVAGGAPHELAALTRKAGLEKDTLSISCMLLRRATDEETRRARTHLPDAPEDADDLFDDAEGDAESLESWADAFAASAPRDPDGAGKNAVRILSDPIRLPGHDAPARYGCSARGLVLARNALRVPSGAAVTVLWPEKPERDAKSGALLVVLPSPRDASPAPPETKPPRGTRGKAGHRDQSPPRRLRNDPNPNTLPHATAAKPRKPATGGKGK
ncbi:MAG: hypothetical protein LIP28_10595 [Deltaproteobacteria bacterium]|nr:hypothetical protein [Deltaproteobacteria bacterium]